MEAGMILGGKYRLVKQIGSGTEGTVFLALHTKTGIFWALKLIRTGSGQAGPDFAAGQDCHELKMMKHMSNRHLPRIIDVFEQEGYVCLVMEYVRGKSLDFYLKGSAVLKEGQALDLALQTAEALVYLESRQTPVCHLDIKPSNLIRRPDGVIKLVDFGAAWKGEGRLPGLGTDGYAAPEQYDPEGKPDGRTDIYALGAVIYKCLAGKCFSASLRKGRIPNCREDFDQILKRCLMEKAGDRYQRAAELKKDLQKLLKKRRREKCRVKTLGACALAFPALAFSVRTLPPAMKFTQEEVLNYDRLLDEAVCVPAEESREMYMQAVFLKPEDSRAYISFLKDAGSDGDFDEDEDTFFRQLLHRVELGSDRTNEELLSADDEAFGKMAFQAGLIYWYDCGREGRRIGRGWFERAARAGQRVKEQHAGTAEGEDGCQEWIEQAELYSRMGKSIEMLEGDGGAQREETARSFWEDQGTLLLNSGNLDSSSLRMQICLEMAQQLPFLADSFLEAGVSPDDMEKRLSDIGETFRKAGTEAEQGKSIRKLEEEFENAFITAGEVLKNLRSSESGGKA